MGVHLCACPPCCYGKQFGIYNASASREIELLIDLNGVAYDIRVPEMILHYFVDHLAAPDPLFVEIVMKGTLIATSVLQSKAMELPAYQPEPIVPDKLVHVGYFRGEFPTIKEFNFHFTMRLERWLNRALLENGYPFPTDLRRSPAPPTADEIWETLQNSPSFIEQPERIRAVLHHVVDELPKRISRLIEEENGQPLTMKSLGKAVMVFLETAGAYSAEIARAHGFNESKVVLFERGFAQEFVPGVLAIYVLASLKAEVLGDAVALEISGLNEANQHLLEIGHLDLEHLLRTQPEMICIPTFVDD